MTNYARIGLHEAVKTFMSVGEAGGACMLPFLG